MKTCDKCGQPVADHDYVLSENERLIIETMRDIRRSPLSPVSARQLADTLGYTRRAITSHLTQMRRRGIVSLPLGRCSGWLEGDVLRELSRIIAGCSHMER